MNFGRTIMKVIVVSVPPPEPSPDFCIWWCVGAGRGDEFFRAAAIASRLHVPVPQSSTAHIPADTEHRDAASSSPPSSPSAHLASHMSALASRLALLGAALARGRGKALAGRVGCGRGGECGWAACGCGGGGGGEGNTLVSVYKHRTSKGTNHFSSLPMKSLFHPQCLPNKPFSSTC